MTTRRSFLTACIATVDAPAIVRASSLMPVKSRDKLYDLALVPVPFGGIVAVSKSLFYDENINCIVWLPSDKGCHGGLYSYDVDKCTWSNSYTTTARWVEEPA